MPKKIKKYKAKRKTEPEKEEPATSGFFGKYAGRPPRKERTPEQKKEYKRLAVFLVGWWSFVAAVYILFVQIESNKLEYLDSIGAEPEYSLMFGVMLAYVILGVVLFFAWLVCNGGFKKV